MWLIYQVLVIFFVLLYLPKFFYDYFFKKKYRGAVLKRVGVSTPKFRQGSPTIWVHAVSVGEVKGVSSLVKSLKEKYPLSSIIISSVTLTGHREAKKILPQADYHLLLPLDLPWVIPKLIGKLRIDLLVIMETDIWPNFVAACKKNGAEVVLVNGKISDKSFIRFKLFPVFTHWYYKNINYFLVQDEIFKSHFIELKIAPEKIKVVPNLKLDDVYEELSEEQLMSLKKQFGLQDLSIVVGSTHEGEEKLILDQLVPLLSQYSQLKIFVVPRHPERFDEVDQMLKKYDISYGRYTHDKQIDQKRLILIDAMGLLRKLYQLSSLAIVAGSFTSKVGGHNILEPLWYATPPIFGPYMFTQNQFLSLVLSAKAGRQVQASEIGQTVHDLLNDSFKRKQMGMRGKDIFIKASGGTKITLEFIQKVLEKKGITS